MDAEQFGGFIQSCRRELGLTQAELAEKLHVTDKAISRWERGVGFPDIKLLEPLAEALGVTLIELMQSRRIEEPLTKDAASALAAETVSRIQTQQKLSVKRRVLLTVGSILIILAECFVIGVSLAARRDYPWISRILHIIGFAGGMAGYHGLRYILTKQYENPVKKTIWHTWQMWVMAALAVMGLLLILNAWRLNRGDPTWQVAALLVGFALIVAAAIYYGNHEFDQFE